MAHVNHGPDVGRLVEILLGLENRVEPTRFGNALGLHELLGSEAADEIVVLDVPDP